MGAAAGAAALGLGVGLSWPRFAAAWSRPGAILDADFQGGRYLFAGRNLPSKSALLSAVGGIETAGTTAIGPYDVAGAPEKVTNGDFAGGTTGWSGFNAGTISVAAGVCTLVGNGGNIPGFQQALALQKGHAYRLKGRYRYLGVTAPAITVSSSSTLSGTSGAHRYGQPASLIEVGATFSADQDTMYVGGRHVQNASTGSNEYDDLSVKEVLPFAGFAPGGFAAIVSGVMPTAVSAGDKVLFEASCGGVDGSPDNTPHERNRVRLVWDNTKHLRLVVTARNVEQANLDLGIVETLAGFEALLSVKANDFRAALMGGPVAADSSGDMPGAALIYLKRQNAGGSTFDGTLDRVTLFPAAWSEAEFYRGQSATSSIAAWGDSLTASSGISTAGARYTAVAAAAYDPDRSIANLGIGGQTATAIAARQGGVPIYLSVSGDQIPAAGGVAVTAKSVANSSANDAGPITDQGAQTLTGWLAGVYGTLSRDASWNLTFTRAAAGNALSCPPLSQFIPELALALRNRTQWLWLGRNGVASGGGHAVEQEIAAAIAYLPHQRYLVGSILTASTDNTGAIAAIAARNAALSATYGPRFVNVLQALQDANDGSANDLTDIAAGYTPRSKRSDAVHLNDAGYAVVAAAFKARNDAMGW